MFLVDERPNVYVVVQVCCRVSWSLGVGVEGGGALVPAGNEASPVGLVVRSAT